MTRAAGVILPRTHLPHLVPGNTATSASWSGYAVTAASGVHLTFISGDFTVPSVNCANSPLGSSGLAGVSHWAGLDGLNGGTVERIGVDGFCDSTGVPEYLAFYQMVPEPAVAFTGVSPGDAVQASVSFTGSGYKLVLTDVTSGASISTTQACPPGSACHNASAEMISDDLGGTAAGGINLADFGMANDTGVTVTGSGGKHGTLASLPGAWTSTKVTMVDSGGTQMAVPSALFGGRAFNVTWRSAS
jgi:hypothetical protein